MVYKQNHRLASVYIMASGLMFALMGAGIKLVTPHASVELIVFFRNLFGFIVLMPFIFRNGFSSLSTTIPQWHILRSLAGLGAMYCFFYGIAHIPLSESVLLSYTTPLFAPFMAFILLREKIPLHLLTAICIGFGGVTLLLNPEFNEFSWASVIALCSGMFAALAMTTIRKMSSTEPAIRVVFYYGLICTTVSAIPVIGTEPMPDMKTLLILAAIGTFATLGQFFLTSGYSRAAVAQVGPFMYSAVVFATLLGWLFWQEIPSLFAGLGILLVIFAGSIALRKSG